MELVEEMEEINSYITYKCERLLGKYPIPVTKPHASELRYKITGILYKDSIEFLLKMDQIYRPKQLTKSNSTKFQETDLDEYIEDDEVENEDDQFDPLDPNNYEQYIPYILSHDPEDDHNYLPMNEVNDENEVNATKERRRSNLKQSKLSHVKLENEENLQNSDENEDHRNQIQQKELESESGKEENIQNILSSNYTWMNYSNEINAKNWSSSIKTSRKIDQTVGNDDVIEKISLAVKNSLLKFWTINSINQENYYKINRPTRIKLFYSIKNKLIKLIKLIKLQYCNYCKILKCKTKYCKGINEDMEVKETDGTIISDNDDDG